MTKKVFNFNSGPAVLPKEVIKKTIEAIEDYDRCGLSILELGHRTERYKELNYSTAQKIRKLLNLQDKFSVLFIAGGATQQFMQVPYNLLDTHHDAAYVVNGIWGQKAADEAKIWGNVEIISNTAYCQHIKIDKDFFIPPNSTYVHLTSNNTVEGTQWKKYPQTNIPLIVDMSSDILSKNIDYNQFTLIYAGAQKNLGAAGISLIIINKDCLGKVEKKLAPILNYQKHIEAESILNTPPVIAMYIMSETINWLEGQGGLSVIENKNEIKAKLIYETLDKYPIFQCPIVEEDRSLMNIVFFITNPAKENLFFSECSKNSFIGIKGYRTRGGARISLYNAMTLTEVEILNQFLVDFGKKNS